MTLHDPDSKNALLLKQEGSFDHSQLIDDEYYEDEDEDMETDAEGGEDGGRDTQQVSIVTTDGGQLIEAGSADGGTIAITIDSQTQQLINSAGGSDHQVMFVVQYPDGTDGTGQLQITNGGAGGQQTATVVAVSATPTVSTPRIISRGGRVTRSAAKTPSSSHTGELFVLWINFKLYFLTFIFFFADVTTLFETVPEETKPSLSNGEGMLGGGHQAAPQISFDTSAANSETINLEEQMQKQKDLEACFGFKV